MEKVIEKVKNGGVADSVTVHVKNPEASTIDDDNERKACNRRRYELAVIRCVRSMFIKWGLDGITDDETVAAYTALLQKLRAVSANTRGYIQAFLRHSPATHKFLWWHGDHEFKEAFPWRDRPQPEIPEDVRRIMTAFNGELYYPTYNIDVFMDRNRLFVSDNWADISIEPSRSDKFRQWQNTQPIVL